MALAGIPRAHRSGALDLLLVQPAVADQVLAGGGRVYRCASCGMWPAKASEAIDHQEAHPEHAVQGFNVPPR
ncbi:hypothetical protein [Myxococcus llanfairpwllgwyngyllgogerychwyrndrobwllllantysiliogogogochensis]|nr:hypothetical protein [Myxococcus llanfairpwllgwyngyllgogerychwyrndrobwllllantysiliogogogochensis]